MIEGLAPVPTRTLQIAAVGVAATIGVWQPAKDPGISLDYWLDASLLVAQVGAAPDIVASVAATVDSSTGTPPTITHCATDGTLVLVLAAGGLDGDSPTIEIVLTFVSGRQYAYAAVLPIRAVSTL